MAEGLQNTSQVKTESFSKGMIKDTDDLLHPESSWTHARNAVNNSKRGEVGVIGNEPSNSNCINTPYTIIGFIHLFADKWIVFSTDNRNSEIGLFDEESCRYRTIVNDPCLELSTYNLIIGQSKENFDCTWQIYWDDNKNPSRSLNIGDPKEWPEQYVSNNYYVNNTLWPGVSWKENCSIVNSCKICTPYNELDCDKIRLARLISYPCIKLSQGPTSGSLLNGSYQVAISYSINQQRVTDYYVGSQIQPLFDHLDAASSLQIEFSDLDNRTFDEFELVVIKIINQQKVAKQIGFYSTKTSVINLDIINEETISVPIQLIYINTPVYDKSRGMFKVNDILLRTSPTTKFNFNYQPLANLIQANWVSVRYPEDYYREHGNNVSYLRDEVYAFFIRWVYDTGDVSPSFHIPGRVSVSSDLTSDSSNDRLVDTEDGIPNQAWRGLDTSSVTSTATSVLEDGGVVTQKGKMSYWESSEKYPDDKSEIWNASAHTWTNTTDPRYDLCGKNIRHHKMPTTETSKHFSKIGGELFINILGVEFTGIRSPRDNDGRLISGIVGYEILRATREGNKTILAKGIINNMGEYEIKGMRGKENKKGLYQNYPYNDVRPDPFLTKLNIFRTEYKDNQAQQQLFNTFSEKHFTFHSPDTSFRNPFLSAQELRIYNGLSGTVEGQFLPVENHPKHKLLTNLSFGISLILGIGATILAMRPKTKTTIVGGVASAGVVTYDSATTLTKFPDAFTGYSGLQVGFSTLAIAAGIAAAAPINPTPFLAAGGFSPSSVNTELTEDTPFSSLGPILKPVAAAVTFSNYLPQFTDEFLDLIAKSIKYKQFAYRIQSHALYDSMNNRPTGFKRRKLQNSRYLGDDIQDVDNTYRVNNQFRNKCVYLNTKINTGKETGDTSRNTMDVNGGLWGKPDDQKTYTAVSKSSYAALKLRLVNQYGQMQALKQIKITNCIINKDNTSTPILFGGDTYINRYTEKNTFFYFYDWILNQPDGFEYDYRYSPMIGFPRFWMNTEKFDFSDFFKDLTASNLLPDLSQDRILPAITTPSDFHNLDKGSAISGFFGIRNAYMYLFNSGIRDFFVESEVNLGHRDWGEKDEQRFYDPYGFNDITRLFNSSIIKATNFNKYDYSLSVARLTSNRSVNQGVMQDRFYNPEVAENCYTTYPNRLLYSLPASLSTQGSDNIEDNWFNFLSENYKDYNSPITTIKELGEHDVIILFERESPLIISGANKLLLSSGLDVSIGSGSLFGDNRTQRTSSAESTFEYGSCQNRLGVINTPSGAYFISQNQGKIFQLGQSLQDISRAGMKWWFNEYLPYKLLEDYPDFELKDNPVSGIGCQVSYDNVEEILYFSKKDYKLRPNLPITIDYIEDDIFRIRGTRTRIRLGDPTYFDDASWTISYDPKVQGWISFHDWHPDLSINTKTNFITTKDNTVWKHNNRCDSFCNFYGVDHPFEIETISSLGQSTTTLKSVEYMLECYNYSSNCLDVHHVLDFNFDRAVVHNSEQVSGLLSLNLSPKNNAPLITTYPRINPTGIDILFSKEEHKYRFNQFWDITDDRGEFTTARRMIWNTLPNGYIRNINQNYVNYNKNSFERKKFRHYINKTLLIRRISGSHKMLLKLFNNKNTISFR